MQDGGLAGGNGGKGAEALAAEEVRRQGGHLDHPWQGDRTSRVNSYHGNHMRSGRCM